MTLLKHPRLQIDSHLSLPAIKSLCISYVKISFPCRHMQLPCFLPLPDLNANASPTSHLSFQRHESQSQGNGASRVLDPALLQIQVKPAGTHAFPIRLPTYSSPQRSGHPLSHFS
ncbi:hypothetical protein K505DRAFT_329376 [Melanomma pulvis-pyrius CBS 109.77]|uniref:Uncharacterized protein n=1 Tax=Melanomma pulvis-pyrius CBS 109.77 TaxID=1314802 RepID=A0A6A6WUT1_9PLEO|nr:hypothetical protein K505DRAFT_329376 [Melanomma pulvis-pyrius CBS 109.77]